MTSNAQYLEEAVSSVVVHSFPSVHVLSPLLHVDLDTSLCKPLELGHHVFRRFSDKRLE